MKRIVKIVICITIVCALIFLNIALIVWGKGDNKSNYLTMISGWVSGVATAFIGVLAFNQNKKYKADADENLEKQYKFEESKMLLSTRSTLVQEIKKALQHYLEEFNIETLLFKNREIRTLNNNEYKSVEQNHIELEVKYFFNSIIIKSENLQNLIKNDCTDSEAKANIIELIISFSEACEKSASSDLKTLEEKLLPLYNTLLNSSQCYGDYLDKDFNNGIINIGDYDFIVKHFAMKTN